VNLIPSILPDYIPPLVGTVNHDSVPRDFNYTLVTTYLPNGIHIGKLHLDKITTLNINDFNLGDRKNFSMLAPHGYLTRTKGNKLRIIPKPWTMDLMQSTILDVMKIPHLGRHQEVNVCVKLLLSSFHGSYLWLDRHITVDASLIHQITILIMQGPEPQDFYPGKVADQALMQKIKGTYDDVEKGKQGYKVASIQNGAVHFSFQLIVGKIVWKNRPMQVTGFFVDLTGKCVEGLRMNWEKYLVNELDQDCHKDQYQGYEFHFSWLLILITFIAWEMLEGETFPELEAYEPLAAKFTSLWYSSDVVKQWQSNVVFHTYYL
jgi:hypothetical protein